MIKNIVILFVLISLYSCKDKTSERTIHYEYTNVDLEHYQLIGSEMTPATSSVNPEKYVLKLTFSTIINNEDSGFSLLDYRPINDNPIDKIIIISDTGFNTSYPIGSTINQNFTHYSGDYPELPNILPEGSIHISNYHKSNYFDKPVPEEFELYFNNLPELPSNHIFTICILLEDGTVLTATSSQITFN